MERRHPPVRAEAEAQWLQRLSWYYFASDPSAAPIRYGSAGGRPDDVRTVGYTHPTMEPWLHSSIQTLLVAFALPSVGLPAIFMISLISATLLPLGSEPAVFGYVQVAPHMFWAAVAVATAGNTLGGIITYAMGAGAGSIWHQWREQHQAAPASVLLLTEPAVTLRGTRHPRGASRCHALATQWFGRFGPPALLLSWLPVVGDPLCAVAGWLRLAFWPSVAYMAIGKGLRYILLTIVLTHAWPWVNGSL